MEKHKNSIRTGCGISRWISFVFCAVFLCMVTNLSAAALPSAVASRVKSITMALDQVDKALQANQMASAQRKIKDAQRIQKEITDRYKGKFDESDPAYKAMTDRLAAAEKKVAQAQSSSDASATAQKDAQAANEALCAEWVKKFAPFTDYKSDQYLRIGSELNSATPEDQAKSKAAFPKAKALFEEYQKVKFTEKTMDLQNAESKLTSHLKYYQRDEDDAAQEAACQEWVDRLGPYVEVGRNSPKRLIASATVDTEQVRVQQELYEEAKKAFEDYKKAQFPAGKTQRLQTIEEEMTKALEEFPKAMQQSQAMLSGDVGKRIEAVLAYFDQNTAWKNDATKKPPTIMERDLKPLREGVEKYAGTVAKDDAKLATLREKLKTLETRDAENRAEWAKRTFQQPDGYTGGDLDALKAKAREAALADRPKAEALGASIPSKDWQTENVLEATDTTRTAWRHRITRSVSAQVTVKDADGNVWLQGVYLGQDQNPDGTWGELKGHTTWADRMAPENVGKPGPQ